MAKTEEIVEEKTEAGTEAADQAENKADEVVEETVPKSRFEDMVGERDSERERVAALTQQQMIIQANQQKPAAKQFDIYAEVGLDPDDPDDIPTQGQLKKIQAHNAKMMMAQMSQIQFLSTHPDFEKIVGTPEQIKAMQWAPPLAKALKENPALLQTILASSNMNDAAYQIAKLKVDSPTETVDTQDAKGAIDEAVKNAQKVKSSSNVAGGSGVLSEAGRIEEMSEDAFLELARVNGATV